MHMSQVASVVALYRVSTDKQGKSGLGLEAQKEAVERYLALLSPRPKLVAEFVEVESGRKGKDDRPQLAKALHHARVTGSILAIAKLDRLSRNVAFLANLMDSGVEFVACDNPHANRLTLHLLAAMAEHEARLISERTKLSLAMAKRRGVRLGNPNGAKHLRQYGTAHAVAGIVREADSRAIQLKPVLEELEASGIVSATAQAKAMNDQSIKAPRGGRWTARSVLNLRARLEAPSA